MPSSYFVPGIPTGEEGLDLRTLELLAGDLRRYADEKLPTQAELAAAPMVSQWTAVPDISSVRLAGIAAGHPSVRPGPVTTSRIYAMAHDLKWVRTYSRLWRLDSPAPVDRRRQL